MKSTTLVAALAVVGVLGGASAFAAATAESDTIRACKHTKRGIVRILRPTGVCKRNETAVSWAVQGPKGDPGPVGPRGEVGPAGPPGSAGSGLQSLGGLAGLACTTFDGEAGTVDLDITPENLVLVSCDSPTSPPDTGTARLVVNEVDYDQVGADTGGFVEIANVGDGDATLDGVAIVLVNGGDGTEYDRVALTGSLEAGGHLRIDVEAQNGAPDGIALLQGTTLLDALSYEGEIRAATLGGVSYDLVEGTPLAETVADSNTVDGSLARVPDGNDTNDASSNWAFTTTPTPGAPNVAS